MTEPHDRALWSAIADATAAHVVMLRDTDVFDDPVAAAILTALDPVRRAEPPAGATLTALVEAFEERLDALMTPEAAGAATLGRARAETAATAARLALRERMLALAESLTRLRLALLDTAEAHVFTLMPAFAEGQPLQPTSLAHWLGGVAGPLERAAGRLRAVYPEIDRSPLGAGAMASSGLAQDRESAAKALGCEGIVPSTFDAVSAVDHLPAALAPAVAAAAAIARFLDELRVLLRTEAASLRVAEEWLTAQDGALPQFRPARGLDALAVGATALAADAEAVSRLCAAIPYGPAGAALDAPLARTLATLDAAILLMEDTARLVAGVEINRAYLAQRAGRDFTTASDLAEFILIDQGIDPASARNIALMTVRKAMDQGMEISGINPQMIDASALLVIGRELGMEIERFGSWLAPRKFLERRTATGGPAPDATRDELERARAATLADERWREQAANRIAAARGALEREVAEILDVER